MDNDKVKPATDLGLALGYTDQVIQRRLNNDSGAGANAGSVEEMTFVTSNALSELVWSPHRGLSLKSADSSLPKKKTSLFWGVGPNNMVLSPAQEISYVKGDGDLLISPPASQLRSVERNSGTSVYVENTAREVSVVDINKTEDPRDDKGKDICVPKFQMCTISETRGINISRLASREDGRTAYLDLGGLKPKMAQLEPFPLNFCEVKSSNNPTEAHEEQNSALMKTPNSTSALLEKLESMDENDLRPLSSNDNVASKSPHEEVKASPSSSRVHLNRRKDKEKASSDGDGKGTPSKDDDDSHESVESCNSARLFTAGKKRWCFEDRLIVGSKRVKRQVQEGSVSTSFTKQDSSFMSWISNMMKGLSKSNLDEGHETPPLSLTQTPHEGRDSKLIVSNKSIDMGCSNTGFQTIFQSLYCPKTLDKEPELAKEICEKGTFPRQFLLSNEEFNKSGDGNKEDPSSMPAKISSENGKTDYTEKQCTSNSAKSSLGKWMVSSGENEDPPKAKTARDFGYRSDALGSLWITRLSPKMCGPALNLDCSTKQVLHTSQASCDSSKKEEALNVVGNELHPYAANSDKVIHKLNTTIPSQRFQSSEAIASIFARRLDALRNIVPLEANATHATTTCVFCGVRGHDIRDCSEVTGNELEELLGNIVLNDEPKEDPCMCIKCFQLNHWAVSCPNGSTKREHISDFKGKNPRMEPDFKLIPNLNGTMKYEKRVPNSNPFKKYVASSSVVNEVRESHITPLSNFFSRQISDVPKGIFEAIKKLRLSRTVILKWMTSQISASDLDGFFLRLRLGKSDKGLGGTGYFVACINGAHEERSPNGSKNLISANVGGTKCLVESRYVSNQDFLEDELMAWWRATSRGGGEIPTERDLELKFEERIKLGF